MYLNNFWLDRAGLDKGLNNSNLFSKVKMGQEMFYLRVTQVNRVDLTVSVFWITIFIKKLIKDIPKNLVHFIYQYTKMFYFSDSFWFQGFWGKISWHRCFRI